MTMACSPSRLLSWSVASLGLLAVGCPGDDGAVVSTSNGTTSGMTSDGTTSDGTTSTPLDTGETGASSEDTSEGSSGVDSSGGTTMCGNGVVEGDEACDDTDESASCDADCTAAECGDATVNAAAGETCDEQGETATCNVDCTAPSCGDSVVNTTAGEECDDGGLSAACDDDCTPAECGDGMYNPNAGELCDEGMITATCDDDCTPAECQDGTLNMMAGEICDEGSQTATCDLDCTPAECGDGYPNGLAGELCDGGGETVFCNADCTLAECGDGFVNATAGELCDDMGGSAACDADCTPASCGDGVANGFAAEQCDDGNLAPGDGCDGDCLIEVGPGDCTPGFTTLSVAPSGLMVECDDPTNTTCEEDMEIMCPAGWGLCSRLQHINRNNAWNVPVGGATVVLGEIYCRNGAGTGAGHYTLGPYDAVDNLMDDPPLNCGYGSSRSICPSGFGCNELTASAICCVPTPSCGNGVVDSIEEECDDANLNEDDACLNSCSWRVPAANGVPGTGC
jgi:cysteine-rich repeat protein